MPSQKLPPQQQVAVPEIAPSLIALNVSESDSTTYTNVRGVYVGDGGSGKDLVVTMNGVDVTFSNVPTGAVLPIGPTAVKTGSTAGDIVLLF